MQRLSDSFLSLAEWRLVEAKAANLPPRLKPTRTMAMAQLLVYSGKPFNILRAFHAEELRAPWVRLPWTAWDWVRRLARLRRQRFTPAEHLRLPFFSRRLVCRWVILGEEGFEKHLRELGEELGVGDLSIYALRHVAGADTVPLEPIPDDVRRALS